DQVFESSRALVRADRTDDRHGRDVVVRKLDASTYGIIAGSTPAAAVPDDGDRASGKVPFQHRRGPFRRGDNERGPIHEGPMVAAPGSDVDSRELLLRGEAAAAHRFVGHAVAIVLARVQEVDRRAGEVEVVNGVTVRNAQRGESGQHRFPATGDVVQVDQADAESGSESAEEVAPELVLR